jgi:predicted Zn finger-like uncharacterized protein
MAAGSGVGKPLGIAAKRGGPMTGRDGFRFVNGPQLRSVNASVRRIRPMLITCPSCDTSYQADLAMPGTAGRAVRCTRCCKLWFAHDPAPFAAIAAAHRNDVESLLSRQEDEEVADMESPTPTSGSTPPAETDPDTSPPRKTPAIAGAKAPVIDLAALSLREPSCEPSAKPKPGAEATYPQFCGAAIRPGGTASLAVAVAASAAAPGA